MRRGVVLVVAGLLVALALGVLASPFASSHPDGLGSAALRTACADAPDRDACLAEKAGAPRYDRAPLPDYGGDASPRLSGLVGVVATFLIGWGIVLLVRAGRDQAERRRAA